VAEPEQEELEAANDNPPVPSAEAM
jgi:hypothetical protein